MPRRSSALQTYNPKALHEILNATKARNKMLTIRVNRIMATWEMKKRSRNFQKIKIMKNKQTILHTCFRPRNLMP